MRGEGEPGGSIAAVTFSLPSKEKVTKKKRVLCRRHAYAAGGPQRTARAVGLRRISAWSGHRHFHR